MEAEKKIRKIIWWLNCNDIISFESYKKLIQKHSMEKLIKLM